MDAKTYPNGILEEMEACPNKMEKSTETWNNKLQRGDVGKFKESLLRKVFGQVSVSTGQGKKIPVNRPEILLICLFDIHRATSFLYSKSVLTAIRYKIIKKFYIIKTAQLSYAGSTVLIPALQAADKTSTASKTTSAAIFLLYMTEINLVLFYSILFRK